jgi:AI-2 transport protein TqsA
MELQNEKASPILYLLQGVACLVIILWGIGRASHLIVLVLLGALLACSFLPLPQWLLERFKFRKSAAIGLGVALLGTLNSLVIFLLCERIPTFRAELPAYQERFMALYQSLVVFLNGHGIQLAGASSMHLPSSEKLLELSRVAIPEAVGFLGDGLLVTVLALIFLSAMVERPGAKRSVLGETLWYYGGDVQRYIGTSAKTNGIAALVNLALFLALGVKFALFWSVLSFFLRFIPNVGFILALAPPSLLTLLVSGWKRALFVAGGLIAINLVMDYVINPIIMKKSVGISFTEIMLSLVFWGAVLGAAAGILAIPLTMALKKFLDEQLHGRELTRVTSG